MYGTGNKKMLNMMILKILKDYSDQEHHLTQKEIIRLLQLEYGMECDRRSVKANILSLIEYGIEISTEDGYYLMEGPFEDAELRMLIDAVLYSGSMTECQAARLIDKLVRQSSKYFKEKVFHTSSLKEIHPGGNKGLLNTVDAINNAISEKKKISFIYNEYGTDFELHPKRKNPYVVNPYQLVFKNGRYYLIGNYDKYDDISHFRLDKMSGVTILPDRAKEKSQVKGLENGLNLSRHVAEHIYMYSGKSIRVRIHVKTSMMTELIDWFGFDFQILNEKDGEMDITLMINEEAIFYWALQYGLFVEVIEPLSLRNRLRDSAREIERKYSKEI